MAEREGFEPSVRLHVRLISSQVHSTTLPPLRSAEAAIVAGNLRCSGRNADFLEIDGLEGDGRRHADRVGLAMDKRSESARQHLRLCSGHVGRRSHYGGLGKLELTGTAGGNQQSQPEAGHRILKQRLDSPQFPEHIQ